MLLCRVGAVLGLPVNRDGVLVRGVLRIAEIEIRRVRRDGERERVPFRRVEGATKDLAGYLHVGDGGITGAVFSFRRDRLEIPEAVVVPDGFERVGFVFDGILVRVGDGVAGERIGRRDHNSDLDVILSVRGFQGVEVRPVDQTRKTHPLGIERDGCAVDHPDGIVHAGDLRLGRPLRLFGLRFVATREQKNAKNGDQRERGEPKARPFLFGFHICYLLPPRTSRGLRRAGAFGVRRQLHLL